MQVNSINQQNFKAKFINTPNMRDIAQYAVEHGKFEKLNIARKNIDSQFLRTRIKVDLCTNENGFARLIFQRYFPKNDVIIPKSEADYVVSPQMIYDASTNVNPLKFAFNKIVKMGNNEARNRMFHRVVVAGK